MVRVPHKKSPYEERFDSGKDFEDFVMNLLQGSGYIEGQIYSTSGKYSKDYLAQLKRLKKLSYVSPNIIVSNKWDIPSAKLDMRFGIACERRDVKFNRFGKQAVTRPRYQSHALEGIKEGKGIPIYIAFGRKVGNTYAVGITKLREPDEVVKLPNHSTGSERWNDVFLTEKLWTWTQFIKERIKKGDPEPKLKLTEKLIVPKLE